jgi:flavocytochrome c
MRSHEGRIVIIGGGLAGLTAAHSVVEAGGSVTLLEKTASIQKPGGNAALTISGINAVGTACQDSEGVKDSLDQFISDIVRYGGRRSTLVEKLCKESGGMVDWLTNKFKMRFILSRSGGHNLARIHKTPDKHTGATTVRILADKLHELSVSKPDRVQILTSCTASKLIVSGGPSVVTGVECFHKGSVTIIPAQAVILATGGFGADFGPGCLLSRFRPDLRDLATSCVVGTTGDGIKMAEAIGARAVDMAFVDVNPLGLVDPSDRLNRCKLSGSDSIRGDGGIIIDKYGKRFVNEQARKDTVWKDIVAHSVENGPIRVVLNSKATKHLEKYIREYFDTGLMKTYSSGAELCGYTGIPLEALEGTFREYSEAARLAAESKKPDKFGKLLFRNAPIEINDQLTVAEITPVIGHCAGGLAIDPSGRVIHAKDNKPFLNLFAAGEVAGGIDPSMLVGNSLLECLVFGRVSGIEATRAVYGPDWVERHMNPAILLDELNKTLERMREDQKLLEDESMEVMEDSETLMKKFTAEKAQLYQMTKLLHMHYPEYVPEMEVGSTDPPSVAISPDPGELVHAIKASRSDTERLTIELINSVGRQEAEIISTSATIAARETELHELRNEKSKLQKQLDKLIDDSVLLREINALEEELSGLISRQKLAEQTRTSEESELQNFVAEKQAEIASIRTKREEVVVMTNIERIESKKEIEQLKTILKNFQQKINFEFQFANTSSELANDPEYPFFLKPLRVPHGM